jgi:hypothetical protein
LLDEHPGVPKTAGLPVWVSPDVANTEARWVTAAAQHIQVHVVGCGVTPQHNVLGALARDLQHAGFGEQRYPRVVPS